MKSLRIISNVILTYVIVVCPTSCRTHSIVCQDIKEKEEITASIRNCANKKDVEEVRSYLYHSFSWKNVDNPELDYYGSISIRFTLTPEYGIEYIDIGPNNLNQSIRKEIIRCIRNFDFRKIMSTENAKDKIYFVFPFSLRILQRY
jgi:hypothetical protein